MLFLSMRHEEKTQRSKDEINRCYWQSDILNGSLWMTSCVCFTLWMRWPFVYFFVQISVVFFIIFYHLLLLIFRQLSFLLFVIVFDVVAALCPFSTQYSCYIWFTWTQKSIVINHLMIFTYCCCRCCCYFIEILENFSHWDQ